MTPIETMFVSARTDERPSAPRLAQVLGFAGLFPQLLALAVLLLGGPEVRFSAMALAYAYAALILSFLGGMWWGLAAQARARVPRWVWFAGVVPSLMSLMSAIPWSIGTAWPGPSLIMLGIALLAALAVDFKLVALGLCPGWWLKMRIPLSIGLGCVTLAIGYLA